MLRITGGVILIVLVLAAGARADGPAVVPRPLSGVPSGEVRAVAISGSTLYVGGDFRHIGVSAVGAALLDPTTAQPTETFPGVDGTVTASAPDGSGGWYLAGSFTHVGGLPRAGLAHVRSDGTVDPAWTPSTDGSVDALALQGTSLYLGGTFAHVDGQPRVDLAAVGAADGLVTSFRADTDGPVYALGSSFRVNTITGTTTVRLYVGGAFGTVAGTARHDYATIDLATGALTGTDPGLNGAVRAMSVQRVNQLTVRVYVAGSFSSDANNAALFGLAQLGEDAGPASTSWTPAPIGGSVTHLVASGSVVYLGGTFTHINGTARNLLAAVSAADGSLTAWAPEIDSSIPRVNGLAVLGGDVYVAGLFFGAGGQERTNAAAFDATTGAVTAWDPDVPAYHYGVQHLATDGQALLVAGAFSEIAGPKRNRLAAYDLDTGALLPWNPDVDAPVDALSVNVTGTVVYAGGQFTTVNGSVARSYAAAFDASTGQATSFDPQPDGPVSSVAAELGTVLLGGGFQHLGTTPRGGLAEVDGTTGAPTAFSMDTDVPPTRIVMDGGRAFLAGSFTHLGSAPRHYFAILDLQSSGPALLSSTDLALDGFVAGFDVDASTVHLVGAFSSVLGQPRAGNAGFDYLGMSLLGWNPQITNADVLHTLGATTFVAGSFTQVQGQPRDQLAAVDSTSGALQSWDPGLPAATSIDDLEGSPREGLVVAGSDVTTIGAGLLSAFAVPPAAPDPPYMATPGAGSVTVAFLKPGDGGAPISDYVVTASPGGATGHGTASPVTVAGLTPGVAYTFTVRAVNAAGIGLPSWPTQPVTPLAVDGGPGAGPGPGAPGAGPVVSGLRLTHRRFAPAKGRARRHGGRKVARGTTFVYTTSAAGTARITIARKLTGRRRGTRCVTHGAPRRARRCIVLKTVGTLIGPVKAGAVRTRFTGVIRRRALPRGSYVATLTLTDAAGRRSAPASVRFTIVKG